MTLWMAQRELEITLRFLQTFLMIASTLSKMVADGSIDSSCNLLNMKALPRRLFHHLALPANHYVGSLVFW